MVVCQYDWMVLVFCVRLVLFLVLFIVRLDALYSAYAIVLVCASDVSILSSAYCSPQKIHFLCLHLVCFYGVHHIFVSDPFVGNIS